MTMTGIVLGTPGYLAPERRSGRPATVQSDLYSVGAVMVEALTGRRAAPGPVSVRDLPSSLRSVAARALSADPSERYPSADAMLSAIRNPGATRATQPAHLDPPAGAAAPDTAATTAAPANQAHAVATVPAMSRPALPETVFLQAPRPVRGVGSRAGRRRRRGVIAAVALAGLIAILFVVLGSGGQPTGPTASASSHHAVQHSHDTQGGAIRSLATSLANAGLPGDGAMARALDVAAGQRPGANREAAAQQAILLAVVLLAGGGITSSQFQDVVSVLQPTGATVPTTTTTPASTVPSTPTPAGHGPHHDQGPGGGKP